MSVEDDLLANLLSVATEELENLNNRGSSLKQTDIFKKENLVNHQVNNDSLSSIIHKGDTDSSDDEENRSHEKKYNECGREIKHLLQQTFNCNRQQQNHYPSNTKSSFLPSNSKSTSTLSGTSNSVLKTHDVFTDPIFGMRIINPLISSVVLKERMVGREAVSFAKINQYLQVYNKERDWVIAGVVASKSAVKTSQKGSQYSIWTLTDLKKDIKTVSLFLFSKAHENFWKTVVGTVIGILNPNVLEKKNGSRDEACLSVDNPLRVLILGTSKDFGTCKSTRKNGEQCNAIVNRNECEYCIYHIKQEYQKCSKRSELQANFAGRGLTALRNKVLGKNEVFYAGKSYMAIPSKKSRKLEAKGYQKLPSLGEKCLNIDVNNTSKMKKRTMISKTKRATGLDVSQAQRLRDIELLKKLERCSPLEKNNSFSGKQSTNVSLEESKNTALNVIDKLKAKNINTRKFNNTGDVQIELGITDASNLSCSNTLNNSKDTTECNFFTNRDSTCLKSNIVNDLSLCEKTKEIKSTIMNCEKSAKFPILSNSKSTNFIDLNTPVTAKMIGKAKLNALKFVQRNGTIKKADPNSTRGSSKKRTMEEIEKTGSVLKKSKLVENEFLSDRFKKMMEATSKHVNLLECRDNEEEEKYFKKLEMKEKMEEKMINTHKLACKAVQCLKCKYTSFAASDLCKTEKHPLKVFDTMKRFYKCGDCGNRTVTLQIIPIDPCKNCGSGKWQKTGMMKDKTVVINNSLSIRGGEQKFVNTVLTDSSINLLVPDS